MLNFERTGIDLRQKNRLLFFAAGAFHLDCDWCFMSLGGIEFAVFSGPSDPDIEARVNGEYLWGRHFYFRPIFSFTPLHLGPLSAGRN